MAFGRKPRETEVDPFYDMLFNILIAFVFCFILALLAMNPAAKKSGDIKAKAEFIITVTWPDNNPNDLDTWVEDPAGNRVWFRQREAGLMHLDRDDRGSVGDTLLVNGKPLTNPLNQEVVTIRGFSAGEYVVNVQYYESRDREPVEATVSIVKINPVATVVYYGTLVLAMKGSEGTAARFTVDTDGSVTNINTIPKKLVETL